MKSSLSAMRSVGGGGARVVHQVVVVVGLLRGTPPVGHAVRHRRRRLLELRPVTTKTQFIVHGAVPTDVSEVRRLIVVGRRWRSLVRLLVMRIEVFFVEAFELICDRRMMMWVVRRRCRGRGQRRSGAGSTGGDADAAGR